MAVSTFGNSYAAQSLGLSPAATGGSDVAAFLKNQLSTLAKRRGVKAPATNSPVGQGSPAAFDLFGKQPLG